MKPFGYYMPTKIIFGPGQVNKLNEYLPSQYKKILIVTDNQLAEKIGALRIILAQLKNRNVFVFDEVEENPSFKTIEMGRTMAIQHQSQLIIGMGGGSPMDAAKGIAILSTNKMDLNQVLEGKSPVKDPLPVICLPTTSGTGSEVTPYAVFTDTLNKNKCGYAHEKIFPISSIIDPELTYTMPRNLVIHTGLDALTHAIEAYLSTESYPLNDQFALHAIRMILLNLKLAAHKNKKAMKKMAFAAMLGGITIANSGTILPHIMGYPLTVFHQIPHGLAAAILMPRFLRFLEEKKKLKNKLDILKNLFKPFENMEAFLALFNISTRLSDYGVKKEEIDCYVKKTIVKGDVRITPARICEKDIAEIYNLK